MNICPTCKKEFNQIGTHWRFNPDHRPSFSKEQFDILRGLMMGDGTINSRNEENVYILTAMTAKNYLQHLKEKFGVLSKDVRIKQTAVESAKAAREKGFRPNADSKNYNDVYKWATCSHPELNIFRDWYQGSSKQIPDCFDLTPVVLRHWIAGDGHLQKIGSYYRYSIALTDQRNNRKVINSLFEEAGLPQPRWSERDANNKRTEISWRKKESRRIAEYIEAMPPGFEYKYPSF